ncbi:hypothetical protein SAMN04488057_105280 [Cyclobacterium lianum]|uniref:Uncharacterized protein n=1 Tax=Cyclobacterium lianum TaxID=388280 RepID=A0A1M7NG83_9BACT|nr:hypothetical protein [Cyclobacterium lianum]SHN02411.1 hypothetical protein SAMN04488057_105280 [Cyclobacterium lianum]
MKDRNNNMEKKIRQTLSKHEIGPDDWVWEKISEKLEKKNKPVLMLWKRWAAVAVLVLGFSWFLLQLDMSEVTEPVSQDLRESVLNDEHSSSVPEPHQIPDSAPLPIDPEAEELQEKTQAPPADVQPTIGKGAGDRPASSGPGQAKTSQREQEMALQPPTDLLAERVELIPIPDIDLSLELKPDKSETAPTATDEPYTVRVVSRGYAIQPDKAKMVDGLEDKIEGFFSKLDQGFGDLQDAKNNLFASLNTKREKK